MWKYESFLQNWEESAQDQLTKFLNDNKIKEFKIVMSSPEVNGISIVYWVDNSGWEDGDTNDNQSIRDI